MWKPRISAAEEMRVRKEQQALKELAWARDEKAEKTTRLKQLRLAKKAASEKADASKS